MIDRDSRAFKMVVDLHDVFRVEERLAIAQKYLDEEAREATATERKTLDG